uniref:Uncharacterized protein n=1 Tax=Fervidicoccus fontis TaxID=683846 RepID=A0A7J3ZJ28_9CREN
MALYPSRISPIGLALSITRRLAEPLYPIASGIEKRAFALNIAFSGLALLPLALLSGYPLALRLCVALAVAFLGLLGVPGILVLHFYLHEHYVRVSRELPLFVTLVLAVTSSGGGIEDAFSSVTPKVFRGFWIEALKYNIMKRVGKTWDRILPVLEEQSRSKAYRRFLRGLAAVASTSGRVPEYSYSFLKDLSRELEDAWSRFWNLSFSIVEVMLLVGVAFMTLAFVSLTLSPIAFLKGNAAIAGLLVIAALALQAVVSAARPSQTLLYSPKALALSLVAITASTAVVFYKLVVVGGVGSLDLIVCGVMLAVGGVPVVRERALALKQESELLEGLREVSEAVKAGFSYQEAIAKSRISAYRDQCGIAGSRRASKSTREFILHLVDVLEEFGAGVSGLLDTIYLYVKDLIWLERRFYRNSLVLQVLAVLLPSLLLAFTLKASTFILYTNTALVPNFLAIREGVLQNLCLSFAVLSVVANMIVSSTVDSTPLSTLRVGLSLIGMAFTTAVLLPLG